MWKKGQESDEPRDGSLEKMEHSSPRISTNVRKSTQQNRQTARPTSTAGQTLICANSTLTGDITGRADVFISGKFKGSINIPDHTVTIDTTGIANAKVNAGKIVVHGTIIGDLQAIELVHLLSTGVVEGDIRAGNMILERGCNFNGSIEMEKKGVKKPYPKKPSELRPSHKQPPLRTQATKQKSVSMINEVSAAKQSSASR